MSFLKERFYPVLLGGGIFCFVLAGFLNHPCQAAAADMLLSVQLDKAEYKPDEPIMIGFKLANKGPKAVYVNKRFYVNAENKPKEEKEVTLLVISPSGKTLPCKFSYDTGLPKSDYFVLLEPGKEIASDDKRFLRAYFDFDEAGAYKISAVYQNVFGAEIGLDTLKEKITSPEVFFKIIKPEDAPVKTTK
jgi:hypothetical protein